MIERWFLLGDIHGDVNQIAKFYRKKKEQIDFDNSINYIILLGDAGINYFLVGQRDYMVKRKLGEYPFQYICLRGNHEERPQKLLDKHLERWEKQSRYGGEILVEKDFPYIHYLSDAPAVYEFAGYKTFSLPGAYSIDKYIRLAGEMPWFEGEQLSDEEMELGRQIKAKEKSFDLVISHTCPLMYEPTDLFLSGFDQSSVDKTMERYLGEIEYHLDYKRWAFGHFHADRLYPWYDGKQILMLFWENVVDLHKFMEMKQTDSLQDILA